MLATKEVSSSRVNVETRLNSKYKVAQDVWCNLI